MAPITEHSSTAQRIGFPRVAQPVSIATVPPSTPLAAPKPLSTPPTSPAGSLFDGSDDEPEIPEVILDSLDPQICTPSLPGCSGPSVRQVSCESTSDTHTECPASSNLLVAAPRSTKSKSPANVPAPDTTQREISHPRPLVTMSSKDQLALYASSKTPSWLTGSHGPPKRHVPPSNKKSKSGVVPHSKTEDGQSLGQPLSTPAMHMSANRPLLSKSPLHPSTGDPPSQVTAPHIDYSGESTISTPLSASPITHLSIEAPASRGFLAPKNLANDNFPLATPASNYSLSRYPAIAQGKPVGTMRLPLRAGTSYPTKNTMTSSQPMPTPSDYQFKPAAATHVSYEAEDAIQACFPLDLLPDALGTTASTVPAPQSLADCTFEQLMEMAQNRNSTPFATTEPAPFTCVSPAWLSIPASQTSKWVGSSNTIPTQRIPAQSQSQPPLAGKSTHGAPLLRRTASELILRPRQTSSNESQTQNTYGSVSGYRNIGTHCAQIPEAHQLRGEYGQYNHLQKGSYIYDLSSTELTASHMPRTIHPMTPTDSFSRPRTPQPTSDQTPNSVDHSDSFSAINWINNNVAQRPPTIIRSQSYNGYPVTNFPQVRPTSGTGRHRGLRTTTTTPSNLAYAYTPPSGSNRKRPIDLTDDGDEIQETIAPHGIKRSKRAQ